MGVCAYGLSGFIARTTCVFYRLRNFFRTRFFVTSSRGHTFLRPLGLDFLNLEGIKSR
jgi:hypothetical protein